MLVTGCVGSGPLERDSVTDHYKTLPVTGPRQPIVSSFDVASSINPWL